MGANFSQKIFHSAGSPMIISHAQIQEEGVFRRVEDKYLIFKKDEENFIKDLYNTMQPSYPDPNTGFTIIKSCYFDSASLDFFQDHFRNVNERYKMRFRQYAPNGKWDENALLEIKRKKLMESKKTRFYVQPDDLDSVIKYLKYFDCEKIGPLNSSIGSSALTKRVNKANNLIYKHKLSPRLSVIYRRLAFQRDDIRITLDQNINFELETPLSLLLVHMISGQEELWAKAQRLLQSFNKEEQIILEVKHQGNMPEWTTNLLNKWQLKQVSFSKYCWALASSLSSSLLIKDHRHEPT